MSNMPTKKSNMMLFALAALLLRALVSASADETTMNPIQYKISNPAPGFDEKAIAFRGESFTVDSPSIKMKYSQVFWRTLPPVDLPSDITTRFANSSMGVTGFEVDVLRRNDVTGETERVPAYHSYNHHYSPCIVSAAAKLKLDASGQPMGPDHGHGKILEFELRDDSSSAASPPPADARLAQAFVHGNGQEHRQMFHGMPKGFSQPIFRPAQFVLTPMQISTNDGTEKKGPGDLLPKFSRDRFPPDVPYSPLLECPCTTRVEKQLGRVYTSTRGRCATSLLEGDCFAAAAKAVGAHNTVASNKTLSDSSLPQGCLVSRTAVGASSFNVVFNKHATTVACDAHSSTKDPTKRRLIGSRQDLVMIGLDVDGATDSVKIILSGPSSSWFGVGFNETKMSDLPYAIIVDGEGHVQERKLGSHVAGTLLSVSVKVLSNTVDERTKIRTVILQRPLKGDSGDHYSFNPTQATINFINALGNTVDLQQHGERSASTLAMFNADTTATCLCTEGGGTIGGIPYDADCKPEPVSDLLAQNNPTCQTSSYAGGLACCFHEALLLDADQTPPDFVDEIFFRFRFYFEDYDATNHRELNHVEWSQNGCDSGCNGPNTHGCRHIEFDVVQGAGSRPEAGTPAGKNVQVFQSTFKAGHLLAESCAMTSSQCMDSRKVGPEGFELILAATHCHAPNCLRQDLINADTGEMICSAIPIHGTSREVYREEGYLFAPPCVWGSAEEGLQAPPVLHIDTNLKMVTFFNSTLGHTGQMGIWQMKAAYNKPLPVMKEAVPEAMTKD